jgi:hypothetical protein
MFHDQKLVEPDLSRPSIRGLAWLLRHPERWPEGFEFNFMDCSRCAMGLAWQFWDEIFFPGPGHMGVALGLTYTRASKIFIERGCMDCGPEDIAADLDKLA